MSAGAGGGGLGARRFAARRGRWVATILAALAAVPAWTGFARATTGELELVHPPAAVVPFAKASNFEGRFYIAKIGSGAQISSGGMKIEFSPNAAQVFLIGAAQFYEYNPEGKLETGLFTIFPFRSTADGVTASILKKGVGGPDRTPPLGTLTLRKPQGRTMEGEIELHASGPFRVVFTELPASAEYEGKSPPAQQLHEPGEPGVQAGLASGWGAEPSAYEGEYALVDPAPDPSDGAGLLGPLISLTQGLDRGGFTPTAGDLTVLRGEVPTAEVNLALGSLSRTFYLTELSWQGDLRVATVHAESLTGPKIGRFEGTEHDGVVKGSLEAEGSSYTVAFEKNEG